jgi:sporulation protein YlmC with PRC-barrel domain
MRTLLTTTALVALFSMGAVAQEATQPAAGNQPVATDSHLLTQGYNMIDTDGLASRLLGFPVYTSAANDAERIGEINDLVIGQDGQVAAVILGVGGFLGIGEKNVAIEYNQLQWIVAEDNTERLVLETNRDVLAAAAEVQLIDRTAMDTAQVPAQQDPARQQVDETQTGAIGQPGVDPMAPGAVPMDRLNREGLVDFDESALTAEDLTGVNVYGPGDEHIGTIGDFVLGGDDRIDAVIIDFGGFLGIGTKQVAVGYENLDFYSDANGNVFLVMNLTREQMEQAPEFNRDTYAQERDTQRLVLQPSAAAASN